MKPTIKIKSLQSGQNWGTWKNEKCSECLDKTTIVYKMVLSGRVFVQVCQKCLADSFPY